MKNVAYEDASSECIVVEVDACSVLCPAASGRVAGGALQLLSPLRTVLVNFSTYGSSLSFRPFDRTRFLYV